MADTTDPTELWNTIRAMQADIEALKLRSVSFDNASEAIDVNDLDYRAVDPNGVLRMVISALNLQNEIGVSAYLAALSALGVPTAWIDADNGKMTSGGGSLTMGDDGLISKGAPIIFDSDYPAIQGAFGRNFVLGGSHAYYNLIYDQSALGTEIIIDGGFELGQWLPDPGTYTLVEHDGGNALQLTGSLMQNLEFTSLGVHLLELDVLGDVVINIFEDGVYPAGEVPLLLAHSNTYTTWTRVRFIFVVDRVPADGIVLQIASGANNATFDNVSVKKTGASGVGVVNGEARIFGNAAHGGNLLESGLYYTMPLSTNAITAVTLTANRQYAIPFYINRDVQISELAINVSTAAAAKLANVAMFRASPSGADFRSLIAQSNDVSVATTGKKSFSMNNIQLTPGLYFLALQSNGAPAVSGAAVTASAPYQGYTAIPSTRVTCKYYQPSNYGIWNVGVWSNLTTTNPLIWALIA